MQQALIFDIKRYAINDGPGIRVTIFLKGCPLNCRWCHNPESISAKPQKMYTASKCIGCGECVKACPNHACTLTPDGIITDPERCDLSGKCAEVCPAQATEILGKYHSTAELLQIIEKERPFFDQSAGGVTFSGGEPLLYPEFLCEILAACGERQIHRCLDTAGLAKTESLLEVAKHTDLFLYDLKLMDSARHKEWTGVGNELILHNLQVLAETGAAIQIRIPLIKGVNADAEHIEAMANFIRNLPGVKKPINLLPYHDIAKGKHLKLGQDYHASGMAEPGTADLEATISRFSQYGLTTTVGG